MKPLETNERVLIWLCAFPIDKSTSKWEKCIYIIFTLCVIMTHLLSLIFSSVFIHQNVSINLEETLFSLFHTFSSASMLYQSIATVFLCHKLAAIFKTLANIYDASKCGQTIIRNTQIHANCLKKKISHILIYGLNFR